MRKIYDFLRSLKLAIVLILYITATSILSTLVPQDAGAPRRFDHFFSSPLFLIPLSLFFLNLLVCTIHRVRTRHVRKAPGRFGPDILHIGLLVMIAGGIITAAGRQEGGTWMSIGDRISVPGGYVLYLTDFQYLTYDNGTPKDWISTVRVEKNGKPFLPSFPIEVNKPLKLGNAKIYQASYKLKPVTMTGLKMVIDPGYYPVLVGLILLALGIFTTYIQKIGDRKI